MSSRVALLAAFVLLLVARVAVAAESLVPPGGSLDGWATVVVDKAGVRLRAAADAPVLSIARKDDELVLDEPFLFGDRWIRVRTADGRVGWVAREHLRPGRARMKPPEPAGRARALLPDEREDAERAKEGDDDLPIVRDPLPPWRARIQAEYGLSLVRHELRRPGPNRAVEGMRRGSGLRAAAMVRGPIVAEGAWFTSRDLARDPARDLSDERIETVDRLELSAGWRDTWGAGRQLSLTLLAGVKRDRLRVARVADPLAAPVPRLSEHDATQSGFRLEYGFLGNRLVAEGEARHHVGRHTKGWSWGGGLRGRHPSGIEAGVAYRGTWYWMEEHGGVTFTDRHVVAVGLGKAF